MQSNQVKQPIDIEKAREHFLHSQYILNDLDKDGKSTIVSEEEVNNRLKSIYTEWTRLEQQYMEFTLQVLQHQDRISTANSSPSHSLTNSHFHQQFPALIDNVYILTLPIDFKYSYVTDGKLCKGSLRIHQSLCVYQVFTRLTTKMTYLHLYGITSERSIYLCINRDHFDKESDLEVAALFFEPSPMPSSSKDNPFASASVLEENSFVEIHPEGFSINNVPILTGMSEIADGTIIYEEPQGYDSSTRIMDTTMYGSCNFDGVEVLYRAFSDGNKTMIVVREITMADRKLMREVTTTPRKLFFTVYRSYFDEEEDMATAKQLLQSINQRTATVRPAVKEDDVQRILGVYGFSEESSLLTPQEEVDAFLEMYSTTSDVPSQQMIVSDTFSPDDQGYSPQRMDDVSRIPTRTSTPLQKIAVTVSTQTPPMDIVSATLPHPITNTSEEDFVSKDSALLFSSTSSSPRYHQTTTNIIEHQQYRQPYPQPQQPHQYQEQPYFGETKSPSSAIIGIQDIIDVKNEIASTKLELSTTNATVNYRRTPNVIRLETKIERLELLLIEYLRRERLDTSMVEHIQNKQNEEMDGILNHSMKGSVRPSTTIGTSSSSPLLHENNLYHHSVGPSSIISSEKTPTKSIWLTDQRPTSSQPDPYQHTDEQPLPLEDLWALLDLAEQLSCQN